MSCIAGEIWYKITCPDEGCKAINFVYGGYFPDTDCSKLDVDGFKCWCCGNEFSFMDDEEPFYIKNGRKSPLDT